MFSFVVVGNTTYYFMFHVQVKLTTYLNLKIDDLYKYKYSFVQIK